MKILDTTIAPGQTAVVKVPVGQLPSGNSIYFTAHVFRAQQPGPVLLLLGGIHGDEINGMEIVRQFIASQPMRYLLRGAVIAIPIVNTYGFINFSREVPDGKDVNRSFPGSKVGSLAARVAYALHANILPLAQFGVDFHTGGQSNYNYPQVRYSPSDVQAQELAAAFGAPLQLAYPTISKSLRKTAIDKYKLPIIVFEGGENQRYDGLSIQHGLEGVHRLLQWQEMARGAAAPQAGLHFSKSVWLRANRGGVFQWMKCSGNNVRKGEPLGFINDPHGIKPTKYIYATRDGYMIGHNNAPVVSQGDALFHIAYKDSTSL